VRTALDLRVLGEPALADRGVGRYARELAAALVAAGADVIELRELDRPPAPGRIAELWEHVLLARDARAARADVVHSPSIDFATTRPGAPYVVTLHDLAPVKQPSRYLRTGVKHRLRYAAVRRATRVIVPSRAVADDAARLLGLARVDVVPEAAAPVFRPTPRSGAGRLRLPERYVVWAGGLDPLDPRKGLEPLVRRVRDGAGPPLVLAGRYDSAAAALAASGRVVLTGRLSDEELAAVYSGADALVLPSEDEGFGLTPHEALACETPVAAYAIPALVEALADNRGVRLVAPGDTDALLAAAAELAGARPEPPARTWADVARETIAVYERALAEPSDAS
jgi:glycosyltransferase involved in cell wall biosynthesis